MYRGYLSLGCKQELRKQVVFNPADPLDTFLDALESVLTEFKSQGRCLTVCKSSKEVLECLRERLAFLKHSSARLKFSEEPLKTVWGTFHGAPVKQKEDLPLSVFVLESWY